MIQIKNAAELQKMRKACAISAAALKAGGEAIEPGITTAEIDKIIYDFIVRHGARPNFLHLYGFPATACISSQAPMAHMAASNSMVAQDGAQPRISIRSGRPTTATITRLNIGSALFSISVKVYFFTPPNRRSLCW